MMHRLRTRGAVAAVALVAAAGAWWVLRLASADDPLGSEISARSEARPIAAEPLPKSPLPEASVAPILGAEFRDEDDLASSAGPRRLRGRVVRRGATGASALPQANVRLRLDGQTGVEADPHRFVSRGHVRSGPDGAFSVGVPEPTAADTYRVVVSDAAVSGRSVLVRIAVGAPDPDPVEVVIDPFDGFLVGHVRDAEGRPIARARVGFRETTLTGDDGAYRLGFVAGRTAALVGAAAPGFATELLPIETDFPGEKRVDFTLHPGGVVEGLVRGEGGLPLAGAEAATMGGFPLGTTTTDAAGRFRLTGFARDVELMSQEVFVRAPGYAPASREPTFIDGTARLTFDLAKGAPLGGVALGHDGARIPYAEVSLSQSPPGAFLTTTAGPDGRFRFPAVIPGPIEIRATARGRTPASARLVLPPGGVEDVRLVFAEAAACGGAVVDPQGNPWSGLTVVARLRGASSEVRATTDAEGRFRLEGLPAHDLEAEVFGGAVRRTRFRATVGKFDHRVTAEAAGIFSGTVRNGATGEPITRFVVRARAPQRPDGSFGAVSGVDALLYEQGRAMTAADGVWLIRLDEFGVGAALGFEILADDFVPFRHPNVIATSEPEPAATVASLVRGVAAEGIVTTADGTPIPNAEVRPVAASDFLALRADPEGLPVRAVRTDAAGRFRLTALAAEPLRLRIAASGRAPLLWGPKIPGGDSEPWRVVLPERGVIRGTALGADGRPFTGTIDLTVSGSPADAGFSRLRGGSDAEGRFAFLGLPPGDFRVQYEDEGAPLRRLALVRLAEAETVELRLGAYGPASVRVRIATTEDAPIPPGATVTAAPQWSAVAQGVRTGATVRCRDGVAEFDGLEAGEYEFRYDVVLDGRRYGAAAAVRLAPGVAPELTLRVEPRSW